MRLHNKTGRGGRQWRPRRGTAVGLAAFMLTSVLSLKPAVPDATDALEPGAALVPSTTASTRPQRGLASFYADFFEGEVTASGTTFDNSRMVAAHPSYPFGTIVRVTNLLNGRTVDVEIIDRGPAAGPRRDGVVIDLSRAAAEALGFIEDGRVPVRLDVVEAAADRAGDHRKEAAADPRGGSDRSRGRDSRG